MSIAVIIYRGIGNASCTPYIAMVIKVRDYPMWRESYLDKSAKKLVFIE